MMLTLPRKALPMRMMMMNYILTAVILLLPSTLVEFPSFNTATPPPSTSNNNDDDDDDDDGDDSDDLGIASRTRGKTTTTDQ